VVLILSVLLSPRRSSRALAVPPAGSSPASAHTSGLGILAWSGTGRTRTGSVSSGVLLPDVDNGVAARAIPRRLCMGSERPFPADRQPTVAVDVLAQWAESVIKVLALGAADSNFVHCPPPHNPRCNTAGHALRVCRMRRTTRTAGADPSRLTGIPSRGTVPR
jgi:hypothetical protein